MTLNSILSFLADYFLFFIYGFLSSYFFKLWQVAKKNFPLAIVFLYTYGLWLAVIVLWIVMQLKSVQAWCVFGSAIFCANIIPLPGILFSYLENKRLESQRQRQARKWQEQRARENRVRQQQAQFKIWEEMLRREQEARAYHAREWGAKQQRNKNQEWRQGFHPQGTLQTWNEDKLSYEKILGLSEGWSEDELKKAYQREAQRTHPDKWVGQSEELRKSMEEEYKTIQRAYKSLKKMHIVRD